MSRSDFTYWMISWVILSTFPNSSTRRFVAAQEFSLAFFTDMIISIGADFKRSSNLWYGRPNTAIWHTLVLVSDSPVDVLFNEMRNKCYNCLEICDRIPKEENVFPVLSSGKSWQKVV